MDEKKRFLDRFDTMKEAGLLDIKFCLKPGPSTSVEEFFAHADRIHGAVSATERAALAEWPSPGSQYNFRTAPWR